MSNPAPAAAPAAAVTLSNGAKITSDMTPQQRFEVIKAGVAAGEINTQFHGDANVTTFTNGAAKGGPTGQVPSKPLESKPGRMPANAPTNVGASDPGRVAAFDAEMRSRGIATARPEEIAAKEEKFRTDSAEWLKSFVAAQPDEWQHANEDRLQKAYAAVLEGKVSFGTDDLGRLVINDRKATAPAAPARDASGKFAPGVEAAADIAAKATNKYGYAPASAITGPLLHGYTLPHGPDREWNVAELIAGLKLARKGNLSQSQLEAILKP